MIQNLLSVLGGIVLLIGLLLAAAIWAKSKIDAKLGPLLKLVESKTGIDLPDLGPVATLKAVPTAEDNPRLDALKDAEALLSHFEAEKNTAGQAAMQGVVQALFTKPQ